MIPLLILLLLIIIYQDLKNHLISVWALVAILIVQVIRFAITTHHLLMAKEIGLISLFLSFQFVAIRLYFYVIKKETTIINTKIGMGDILFFPIMGLNCTFEGFLIYFLSTLILGLIFATIRQLIGISGSEIPLAGIGAIVFVFFICIEYFLSLELLQLNGLFGYR